MTPPLPNALGPSFPRRSAFTLVEVLLAIGLATALLLVALSFYQQAANLRTQILQASQNLAALRLTLDLLANDLRSALPNPSTPFIGGPSSLEFARLSPPQISRTSTNRSSPIQKLSLAPLFDSSTTNLSVQALLLSISPITPAITPTFSSPSLSNSLPESDALPDFSASLLTDPPDPSQVAPSNSPAQLPVRFLHLRYWNGFAWQDSWFAPAPPRGVEITLGLDPLPDDLTPDKYPFDAFRRVVLIPAGRDPDPDQSPGDPPDPSVQPLPL